jgi:hypothetical protein
MATASVSEVAAALRTALADIEGLRVSEYIPDSLNPPLATVAIDDVQYHTAFGYNAPRYTYNVSVIVARSSERIAQRRLDGYLSATGGQSVREAIEKDPTLCETVQTCQVVSGGNIVTLTVNDVVYLFVEFVVEVHP